MGTPVGPMGSPMGLLGPSSETLKVLRKRHHALLDSDTPPWFFLFTDASPQWRGMELMASTLDLFFDGEFIRIEFLPRRRGRSKSV